MNCLITGGMGYIGSHIIVELIECDLIDKIIIVDNLCNSFNDVIDKINIITNNKKDHNIIFFNADIKDNILDDIFKYHKIDFVIHCAGLKAVYESIKDPLKYYDNNICGTINLLNIMKKYDCKKLIFSSSATVYGNVNECVNESSQTGIGLTNPYGKSKYIIEEMLKDVSNLDGWSIILLRYFNPIGSHPSGLLNENPKCTGNMPPNNLFPVIVKVAKEELEKLTIFGNDYDTKDGTCVRDFINVVDLAKGHIASIKKLNENGLHIYNLGTGNGTSVYELIIAYEKANNIKLNYVWGNRRDGDVQAIYSDCSKAKNELGWETKISLEDSCKNVF